MTGKLSDILVLIGVGALLSGLNARFTSIIFALLCFILAVVKA